MEAADNYFVCIGAQKAGTSWLHGMLRSHPDVWVPPAKELHYFDSIHCPNRFIPNLRVKALRAAIDAVVAQKGSPSSIERLSWLSEFTYGEPQDDDWYRRIMAPGASFKAFGETTPAYSILPPKGFAHIARLAPKARLIFILRDPIDRMWSHLRFEAKRRNDPSFTTEDTAIEWSEKPTFADRTDYTRTIRHVSSAFPDDQLLILFYEDMVDAPHQFLADACEFLGVRTDVEFPKIDKVINKSPRADLPSRLKKHLIERYAPLVDEIEARLGRVPEAWRQSLLATS